MIGQFLATGLVLAALYALLATGYVVIYRASRIVNLAQGELMMVGGYFLLVVVTAIRAPLPVALFLALALGGGTGLVVYYVVMRRLLGQPVFVAIIVTVGLSVLLRGIATILWTPNPRFLEKVMGITNRAYYIGDIVFSTFDLALIGAAAFFLIALFVFFRFTRIGVQMRATAEQPLLASFRGINVDMVFALSWAIAALIASAAGILYGANVELSPDVGWVAMKALGVVIVGGMDSLAGIIPGALLVGILETYVLIYVDPRLADPVPMLLVLLVLLVRPWGIFGRPEEIERV